MKTSHRDKYKRSTSPLQQKLAERNRDKKHVDEKMKREITVTDPVFRKSQPTTSIIGNYFTEKYNNSVERVERSKERMNDSKERATIAETRANNTGLIARTVMQDMQTDYDNAVHANKMGKMAFQTDLKREKYEQKKLDKEMEKLDGDGNERSSYKKAFDEEYEKQEAKRGAEDAVRQSKMDQQNEVFKNFDDLHASLLAAIAKQLDKIIEAGLTADEMARLMDAEPELMELEEAIHKIVPDSKRRTGMIAEIRDVMAIYEARRSDIVDL